MKGFGMMPMAAEGAPMHPDDTHICRCDECVEGGFRSDDWYLRQLRAYADFHGKAEAKRVFCSRPHLLERLA